MGLNLIVKLSVLNFKVVKIKARHGKMCMSSKLIAILFGFVCRCKKSHDHYN